MAERVASLDSYVRRLYRIVDADAMRRIGKVAGFAGKDAGMDAARATLGQDRAMSNFKKGKVALSVGFDEGMTSDQVVLKHGPAGLWKLADKGRHRSGKTYPKRNGRKTSKPTPGRAVMTPQGPRASSSWGPSRGLDTFKKAAGWQRRDVPKAAFKALLREIPKAIGKR